MNSKIMIQNFQQLPLAKKVLFHPPRENRDFHLHCTMLGGGHEDLKSGSEYYFDGLKRGSRYFCNLQFCLAGCGELEADGQIYTLGAGDLFLTEVPHDHRYYLPRQNQNQNLPLHKADNATGWEFTYLTLTGSELQRIVSRLLELNQSPIFSITYEQLQILWDILTALLSDGLENLFFYSGKVYQLLLSMLSEKLDRNQLEELPAEIRRMQEFIYSHYQDNIGIADISQQSGLSASYAMRLFKQQTAKTIHQFLEEVRLTQAQNLLQYSIRNIKEISAAVGFKDHNYFIRVFSRQFGVTPGKFRRL